MKFTCICIILATDNGNVGFNLCYGQLSWHSSNLSTTWGMYEWIRSDSYQQKRLPVRYVETNMAISVKAKPMNIFKSNSSSNSSGLQDIQRMPWSLEIIYYPNLFLLFLSLCSGISMVLLGERSINQILSTSSLGKVASTLDSLFFDQRLPGKTGFSHIARVF